MSNEPYNRKPTRLKDFDYNTNGAYFITVCTEGRKNILSRIIPPQSVGEGQRAYGGCPSPTVSDVICSFKSFTSRICKSKYGVENIWQVSFFDHIIRDKDDYDTRVKYIYENPVKLYYDKP